MAVDCRMTLSTLSCPSPAYLVILEVVLSGKLLVQDATYPECGRSMPRMLTVMCYHLRVCHSGKKGCIEFHNIDAKEQLRACSYRLRLFASGVGTISAN